MNKIYFFVLFVMFSFVQISAQNNLVYPVIFVHGLVGSDETFGETMEYLRDYEDLGNINVFDVVLNADNNDATSNMSSDVKWTDFWYNGDFINVGRRNYAADINDFTDGWTGSNIFAVNFKEERIRGAAGIFNDYFDYSDQAGIFKQGYALSKVIADVLAYTGAEKVILVGHSMGGLSIREYLQRTNSSGVHVNWIDPYSADGHKVARVATYGTPHLGSNAGFDPTKSNEKSAIPDENTEANRDLLWEYDSYTNCGGTPQGIYMFGGNEECIQSVWYNTTFLNVDVNCNGSEGDYIVGINESYYTYNYNPSMPLPLNIKYTYMTSIWLDWGSSLIGDGAVNITRQWLHSGSTPTPVGLADTTLADINHLAEGSDYKTIIRGIDEPESYDLAFKLKFNREVIGHVTYQQNYVATDIDMYKVDCSGKDAIAITIDGASSGVNTIGFYDANKNILSSKTVSSFPNKLYVNVPAGASQIYIKITGTATSDTWKHPYKINVLSGSWTGVASTDWSSSSNWTAGTPDVYDDVFVPVSATYMPAVNTNVDCNRMNIESGANLSISVNASINFHNDMILNGDIILKSDFINSGSYLDNGNISGNGNVIFARNLQSGGFHCISSHVNDGSSDVFTDLNNGAYNSNFYIYDETLNSEDWSAGWVDGTGIMQQAKGYAYYAPYEQVLFNLSGTPNTGNISIPVTNSNYGINSDGWNLIGNPYPSAVSAINFLNLNNSGIINGAIYLWDEDYVNDLWSGYGVYNLSGYVPVYGSDKIFNGYIAPGQGFFVYALNSGDVSFTNSIRSNSTSNFFKNSTIDEIKRFYLNLSGNNNSVKILLAFTDNASEAYDISYDALNIKSNPDLAFYSVLDDKDLIIQSLPDFGTNEYEINLGTDIVAAGDYTFTFDDFVDIPSEINIYLRDSKLNIVTNLREQAIYETYIGEGVDKSRFSIIFTTQIVLANISDIQSADEIYAFGNKIYFKQADNSPARIYIYNTNGQLIKQKYHTDKNRTMEINNFSTGIYLVKIVSEKSVTTKKIFIK